MNALTKRRKFILSSLFLAAGLYWSFSHPSFDFDLKKFLVLPLAAGVLTFWSLREAASGTATIMTPVLPIFFTLGAVLFRFLIPASFFSTFPLNLFPDDVIYLGLAVLYFIIMYAIFLIENIFSVAAIRTINLFRSASAVGFLITLLGLFLLYSMLISLKLPFYSNFFGVLLITYPIIMVSLWTVNLEEIITRELLSESLLISLVVAELEIGLSFWPVSLTYGAIFLVGSVYVLLGLTQAFLGGRLFKKTINEYLFVGLAIFLTIFFYTRWG